MPFTTIAIAFILGLIIQAICHDAIRLKDTFPRSSQGHLNDHRARVYLLLYASGSIMGFALSWLNQSIGELARLTVAAGEIDRGLALGPAVVASAMVGLSVSQFLLTALRAVQCQREIRRCLAEISARCLERSPVEGEAPDTEAEQAAVGREMIVRGRIERDLSLHHVVD